jgi:hypothetical protein
LFYACNCSASFAFEAGLHDHGSDGCGSDDDAFDHDEFAHLFAAEFAELFFSEELGDADGDFFHFFGVFLVFYAELRVGCVVGVLEEVVGFFEESFCEGLVIGEEFFELDWDGFFSCECHLADAFAVFLFFEEIEEAFLRVYCFLFDGQVIVRLLRIEGCGFSSL